MKTVKKTLLLLGISSTLAFGGQTMALAAEEIPVVEQQATQISEAEEVKTFITAFVQEHTQAGIDSAMARAVDSSGTHLYRFVHQILFNAGLQRYDNISVNVYPVEGENIYVAVVRCDMVIDGIEPALANVMTLLVKRQADGNMIIDTGMDYFFDEYSYDKIMESIDNTKEIIAIINEASDEYDAQLEKYPKVSEWLDILVDAVYEAVEQVYYDDALYNYLFSDYIAAQDSSTGTNDTYTVK